MSAKHPRDEDPVSDETKRLRTENERLKAEVERLRGDLFRATAVEVTGLDGLESEIVPMPPTATAASRATAAEKAGAAVAQTLNRKVAVKKEDIEDEQDNLQIQAEYSDHLMSKVDAMAQLARKHGADEAAINTIRDRPARRAAAQPATVDETPAPRAEPEPEPARADPRLEIGAKVRKRFVGSGWFDGSVTSITATSGSFEVRWSDGEEISYKFKAATKMLDLGDPDSVTRPSTDVAPEPAQAAATPAPAPLAQSESKEEAGTLSVKTAAGRGEAVKQVLRRSMTEKSMDSSWLDNLTLSHYESKDLPRTDEVMDTYDDLEDFVVQSKNKHVATATWLHTNGDQLRITTELIFDKTYKAWKERSDDNPKEWTVHWDETHRYGDGYSLNRDWPVLEIEYVPSHAKRNPAIRATALKVHLVDDPAGAEHAIWELTCLAGGWLRDRPGVETYIDRLETARIMKSAMKHLGVTDGDVNNFFGSCLVLSCTNAPIWRGFWFGKDASDGLNNKEDDDVKKAMAHIRALGRYESSSGGSKWLKKQHVQPLKLSARSDVGENGNPSIKITKKILSKIPHEIQDIGDY